VVAVGDRPSPIARRGTRHQPFVTVLIGAAAVVGAIDADHDAAVVVAVAIGFVLCLGGDVALLPSVDRFVVGLASFLLGHVALVVAFVLVGLDEPWLAGPALVGAAIVCSTVGRRVVAGARRREPGLAGPVMAYLVVISSMAVFGWASGRVAAIVGSSAFVVSDSILGWSIFVERRRWMPLAVMVTYHVALGGLAVAFALT
jgi:uncharacterized membrane protein YhhN